MRSGFQRPLGRRQFLQAGGAVLAGLNGCMPLRPSLTERSADVNLRVEPLNLEIAPRVVVSTSAYNGRVPGPVIRLPRGREAVIDVSNHTRHREFAHWHGLHIPSDVDGAEEEGTLAIAPGETRRYVFQPQPAGTHWYHTHQMGHENLSVGAYTGQYGFFIIDAAGEDPGDYDQEVMIAMHHWGAHWVPARTLHPDRPDHGLDVAYTHATMNDRMLGHGEPLRVTQGQRVLLRMLNASATENTFTHLPGHLFKVLSMDGTRVATPREVEVLMLGPGERADVLIEMNRPGVWIMGATASTERERGLGIVVEYAGAKGPPVWENPRKREWSYLWFGRAEPAPAPDHTIELRVTQTLNGTEGHDSWPINGAVWPNTPDIVLVRGRRYRLVLINDTLHGHPLHLHRHMFELTSYKGVATSGLKKDVINVMPQSVAEVDFVADNVGPTLFHCHQVKHQDFGLMTLLTYEGDHSPAAQAARRYKTELIARHAAHHR